MNATCFLLTGLMAGADSPPAPVAATPVVVSTGTGCVGCGPVVHAPVVANPCNPCNPCGGQHATLVDWMKAKAAEPSKPGLIGRLRARHAKPAAAPAAANPCDPCATGVVSHHHGVVVGTHAPALAAPGTVVGTPGAGTTTTTPGVPNVMPKQKDMPKVDPPKDLPKDPPKTGTDLPKTATPPKTGLDVPPPAKPPLDVPKTGGGIDIPKVIDPPKGPGAISVPPLPVIPTSGTNSPY